MDPSTFGTGRNAKCDRRQCDFSKCARRRPKPSFNLSLLASAILIQLAKGGNGDRVR